MTWPDSKHADMYTDYCNVLRKEPQCHLLPVLIFVMDNQYGSTSLLVLKSWAFGTVVLIGWYASPDLLVRNEERIAFMGL